jgi:glycosyltransferase involved in cell wall biosynthesis
VIIHAQLGARMHYAVPRIFWGAGMLERLYTDFAADKGWLRLVTGLASPRLINGLPARIVARVPAGLPPSKVVHWPEFALEYFWRQRRAKSRSETTATHLWAAREFCRRIIRHGLRDASSVYTFNSAGLELLEYARERGLFCVMEQTIAPAEMQEELLAGEHRAFPRWEPLPDADPQMAEFAARERAEWDCADLIVCGSEFVREGIAKCGGPAERCVVVPYGVDSVPSANLRSERGQRLKVLIAGAIGLRKGAQYVLEAARELNGATEFRWCGGVALLPAAASQLSAHVELRGAVPRSQMKEHYAWADVFLLASICEGSATVCYEALAAGLPVITTPNAGSVVRHGTDGFIVPIRDGAAIAGKLRLLAGDREWLSWMSANATARSREFTVEKYGERLVGAIRR